MFEKISSKTHESNLKLWNFSSLEPIKNIKSTQIEEFNPLTRCNGSKIK